MTRRLLFSAALAFAVALGVSSPACSNQSEGDRCDRNDDNGGNDDCGNGLICTRYDTLGGAAAANQTDICCPQDRAQATTAICALHANTTGADAATPTEGGSDTGSPSEAGPDTSTPEAGSDTGSDAPADTNPPEDAPADAPDGG